MSLLFLMVVIALLLVISECDESDLLVLRLTCDTAARASLHLTNTLSRVTSFLKFQSCFGALIEEYICTTSVLFLKAHSAFPQVDITRVISQSIMYDVPFNKALIIGQELENLNLAFSHGDIKGTSTTPFISRCEKWVKSLAPQSQIWLTTSGTAALEFAALLADVGPGDEIIMPSYTYVSTMNAFTLRGCTCVFVDINKKTMNMDESLISAAITPKTRAIVPVHYSSLACEMDPIMAIAERYKLLVIEDAACCLGSEYKSRPQGSIGHIGCFSFHATKPFTAGGQGGAIMVNSPHLFARAEIIYENGTDRRQFGRGEIKSYTVQDVGSNFQMSETAAACLWAQLDKADAICTRRATIFDVYYKELCALETAGHVEMVAVPESTTKHNGGQFWLLCRNLEQRGRFIKYMKDRGIETQFHFQPLHTSPLGRKTGRMVGEDRYASDCSLRIVRLPIWYAMTMDMVHKVVRNVYRFFAEDNGARPE